MTTLHRCVIHGVAALMLLSSPLTAADSVEILIRRLGHPEFDQRVAAQRELLQRGSEHISIIGDAAESDDPEIRQRSRRLLDQLQRMAFLERQEAIRGNPWAVVAHVVPHWEFYQSLVGDGPAARELYVRMLQQETDLLMLTVRSPDAWSMAYEQRCSELRTYSDRRFQRDIELSSVATLILLGTLPQNKPSPAAVDTVDRLLSDSRVQQAIQKTSVGEAVKGLLNRWVESSTGSPLTVRMDLAKRYELPGGAAAAREILAARHLSMSPNLMRDAVLLLARLEGRGAIDDLALLVEDETALPNRRGTRGDANPSNSRRPDVQLGDLALHQLLLITGQDPKIYGFEEKKSNLPGMISLEAGFPTMEARRDAILRWKSWTTLHLPPASPFPIDASEGLRL